MLVLVVCVAVHFAFTLEAAMRFHSTASAIFWKPYCVFERVVGDSEHNSRRLVAQIVITFDFLLLPNLHLAEICGQERPTDCLFQVVTKLKCHEAPDPVIPWRKYMRSMRVLLSCVVLFALCIVAAGQAGTGSIAGIVTDPSGAVVQGASVTATN